MAIIGEAQVTLYDVYDGQNGQDGKDGGTGVSVSSVINYYLATAASTGVTRSTSGWTKAVQNISADKRFLWNYEETVFSNGQKTYTDPSLIGTYGIDGKDGVGKDGVGIGAIEEFYQLGTSNSTAPTGTWTAQPTATNADKPYLWNYEKITYTNGSSTTTAKKVIGTHGATGSKGDKGDTGSAGKDGVGINNVQNFYLATAASTGVTTSTTGFTEAVQSVTATNKYLWNYEKVTKTDGSVIMTDPCIIGAYGDKGATGNAGKGISKVEEFYQLSASNTTAPTGTWSSTALATDATNRFLWNYEKITYTDNGTFETKKRVIGTHGATGGKGDKGDTGNAGKGISAVTNYFMVSTAATGIANTNTAFSTSIPTLTATNKYLWNYEKVSYTDGSSHSTTPTVIGVYGDKGDTGNAGKGISSIVDYYQLSNSNTTAPTGQWTTTVPVTTTSNRYLWNYSVTNYTTGTPFTSEKRVIGTHGATGATTYTWIKYADDAKGTGLNDSPTGKRYMGIATNKTTATESTVAGDYTWSPLYDNVTVGGRNLFRKSGNFDSTDTMFKSNGGGYTLDTTVKYDGYNTIKSKFPSGLASNWIELENGVEYTYSIMFKSDTAITGTSNSPVHLQAGLNKVNQFKLTTVGGDQAYTASDVGKWKRLYTVFKLTGDANTARPFVYLANGTTEFHVANAKLEKGNIPTDWTVSPEEFEDSVKQVQENLDNLQLGGRNLIRNGKNPFRNLTMGSDSTTKPTVAATTTEVKVTVPTAGQANFYWNAVATMSTHERKQHSYYTVSFDIKTSSVIPNLRMYWYDKALQYTVPITVKSENTWERHSFTYPKETATSAASFLIGFTAASWLAGSTLEIKNVMFEEGQHASSFTVAIEDLEAATSTVQTNLNNMKIGGRNLLLGSNNITALSSATGATASIIDGRSYSVVTTAASVYTANSLGSKTGDYQHLANNLTVGDAIVISFERYVTSGAVTAPQVYLHAQMGYTATTAQTTAAVGKWTKFYLATTWKAMTSGSMHIHVRDMAIGSYIYRNFMIEKGTKCSEYSLAPEDVEGLFGTVDDKVATFMDENAENIVDVVTKSEALESMFNGYAKTTSLENMATNSDIKNVLEEAKKHTDKYILGEGDIEGLQGKVNSMASSLEASEKDITARFATAGGVNLIRNSIGYSDLEFWNIEGSRSPVTIRNTDLEKLGYGSAFKFPFISGVTSNTVFKQAVSVAPNEMHTFTVHVKPVRVNATAGTITVQVLNATGTEVGKFSYDVNKGISKDFYRAEVKFVSTTADVTFKITVGYNAEFEVTGMMMNKGDMALAWQHAKDEFYNTNIQMNLNGIKVVNARTNGYTIMSPSEFSGYGDVTDANGVTSQQRIFSLNGDTTEVTRLQVDKDIEMTTIKMVDGDIGGNKGIVFVATT